MSIACENIPGQIEINAIQRIDLGCISVLWDWSFCINYGAVWSFAIHSSKISRRKHKYFKLPCIIIYSIL